MIEPTTATGTTATDAVAAAYAAGFTHVECLEGARPLFAWTPYGKREGHHIGFRFDATRAAIVELPPAGHVQTHDEWYGYWRLS